MLIVKLVRVALLKDKFGNLVNIHDLPKAEVFKKYFISVFVEDNGVIPDPTSPIVANPVDHLNSVFLSLQMISKGLKAREMR